MIFEGKQMFLKKQMWLQHQTLQANAKTSQKTTGKKNLKRNPEQSFHPHHFWLFIHLFDP
jgi:hypothetical protein